MKEENKVFIETAVFTGRRVPIMELSKAIWKNVQFICIELQRDILTFGFALKKDNSIKFNYYCLDKKVWENIGYFKGGI